MKEWRMVTNAQGTRPSDRAGEPTVADTTIPAGTATNVGGVAVYDRDGDGATDTVVRPTGSIHSDPVPVETRSSGSILSWIIGAIVLIVLAYFILQLLF
jgi:hypothetical protein